MSLLSAIRTVVHRKIVLPGMNFLYGRVYGMDLGKEVWISMGAKLDKTHPEGIHIGDDTAITSGAAILTHDFVNRTPATSISAATASSATAPSSCPASASAIPSSSPAIPSSVATCRRIPW